MHLCFALKGKYVMSLEKEDPKKRQFPDKGCHLKKGTKKGTKK